MVVTKAQIAAEIRRIIDNQLDDCQRAIKAGTKTIAVNELEDASRKLKKLAAFLGTDASSATRRN